MSNESTWSKRVDEWRKSGLTAARFCEGREFTVSSLRTWSSRIGRRSRSTTSLSAALALARVVPTQPAVIRAGRLRVELDDVTLDLPADAEPDFVAALADAVLRRRRRA